MNPVRPLDDAEWQELEAFLDSEELPEEAMDLLQAHGLLAALAVGPEEVPEEEWLAVLFGGEPRFADPAQAQRIPELLRRLLGELAQTLEEGEPLEPPCDPELGPVPDESPLRAWCAAFMEGHLLREEAWFAPNPDEVGELLLPAAVLSGLVDDPDFRRMERDPKLVQRLAEVLPDHLRELYLLFRLPEA